MPGDPALVLAGEERGDPKVLAQIRAELWLDRSLPVQYFHWIGNVLQGDLGYSWRIRQPVSGLIATKLPVTLQLGGMAFVFAVLIGVPAGIVAAGQRKKILGYLTHATRLPGLFPPTLLPGVMLILPGAGEFSLAAPAGF